MVLQPILSKKQTVSYAFSFFTQIDEPKLFTFIVVRV